MRLILIINTCVDAEETADDFSLIGEEINIDMEYNPCHVMRRDGGN